MRSIDPIIFVTGIDTATGKTYVTGLLAAYLLQRGRTVITQKLVETGGRGLSEDIRVHRRLMAVDLYPEDHAGETCLYVFEFPASPHLAARREGVQIDLDRIHDAADRLVRKYDVVIVEGVGGLCVPLTPRTTVLEYAVGHGYPVLLVSSSRLGSINHTLLSLEALHQHGARVLGIAYNLNEKVAPEIVADSRELFERKLVALGYPSVVIDIPRVVDAEMTCVDFGALFA